MVSNVGLKALREAAEQRQDTSVVPHVLKLLAMGGGGFHHAAMAAEAHDAPPAVKSVLKAVSAGSTSTLSDLSGTGSVVNSWAATLGAQSVFSRMFADDAFIQTPFHKRFGAATAPIIGAGLIDEGKPVPVSPFGIEGDTLEPVKAAAMVVLTDEAWRDASDAGLRLVTQLLNDAIAKALDETFFLLVNDLSPVEFTADGDSIDAIRLGLRQLLSTVHTRAGGRLYFAATPEAANRLALYSDFASGGMTPMGGTLVGIPVIVTEGLTSGDVALVDASGIAANLADLEMMRSNAGAIQMLDADEVSNDTVTPVASTLVSLFQSNSTAMRAVVRFGAARTRDGVVATLNLGAS